MKIDIMACISSLLSFCYEKGRIAICDKDDEDRTIFSDSEMCNGKCEVCDKSWGDSQ